MIYFLSTLYACLVILSPVFSTKIVEIGAWHFLAWTPVGILTVAIIDSMNNHFGKGQAKKVVLNALLIRAFIYLTVFPVLFLLPNAGPYDVQPILAQTFRNFLVSEATTFFARYFVEIPIFAKLEKWAFIAKHAFANTIFMIVKGSTKVFFQYVGVVGVALIPLIIGDVAAKLVSLYVGAPFAWLVNAVVGKIKTHYPKLV